MECDLTLAVNLGFEVCINLEVADDVAKAIPTRETSEFELFEEGKPDFFVLLICLQW